MESQHLFCLKDAKKWARSLEIALTVKPTEMCIDVLDSDGVSHGCIRLEYWDDKLCVQWWNEEDASKDPSTGTMTLLQAGSAIRQERE